MPLDSTSRRADIMIRGETKLALPPRRRRWLISLVLIPSLVYGGVVAIFFSAQRSLIFPGSATQGKPEAIVAAPADGELLTVTTPGGDRVVALFGKALHPDGSLRADAATCPTLLYFYGNAMCLSDAEDQMAEFRRIGCNVLIPDYLGYGMSGGEASEAGCHATADAALAHLLTRQDIDSGRIIAAGWSLGGAVAIDLASRRRVAGLATFSSFTSMADMAKRVFPFLPTAILLRHRFDSLGAIDRVECPILIGHGRADRLIPVAMADQLAERVKTPLTRVTIAEADHNDFFIVGGDELMRPLARFVEQVPRSDPGKVAQEAQPSAR